MRMIGMKRIMENIRLNESQDIGEELKKKARSICDDDTILLTIGRHSYFEDGYPIAYTVDDLPLIALVPISKYWYNNVEEIAKIVEGSIERHLAHETVHIVLCRLDLFLASKKFDNDKVEEFMFED